MSSKPEIAWNREMGEFEQDGKPVTMEQARERWNACDSDWTMGAYQRMLDLDVPEARALGHDPK